MNILFIHPVMFHPQRGGIERVSDLLCREFIRRGHHVLCLHSVRDESRMDYAYPSNPQLSSSASFLRLNVLSSLN